MPEKRQTSSAAPSRRGFLTGSAVAAAGVFGAGITGRAGPARGASREPLRVGLIGCGGRGTGAATQALRADPDAALVAMGDVFPDRLESSLAALSREEGLAARIDVPKQRQFV